MMIFEGSACMFVTFTVFSSFIKGFKKLKLTQSVSTRVENIVHPLWCLLTKSAASWRLQKIIACCPLLELLGKTSCLVPHSEIKSDLMNFNRLWLKVCFNILQHMLQKHPITSFSQISFNDVKSFSHESNLLPLLLPLKSECVKISQEPSESAC